MTPDQHYTYKDLKSWPEGERWEIIRGQAYQISSPLVVHQRILKKLLLKLEQWFEGKDCEVFLSPVDVVIATAPEQAEDESDTVLIPDLSVVCDPWKVGERGISGAPDWVIEVLSPSTSWRDLTEKREVYEHHGVREYWVLHPETLDLTIFRLEDGRYRAPRGANLKEPVEVSAFPGLRLDLSGG